LERCRMRRVRRLRRLMLIRISSPPAAYKIWGGILRGDIFGQVATFA